MSTLLATFTPQLVSAQLSLGLPTLSSTDSTLVSQCTTSYLSSGEIEIYTPEDALVQLCAVDFTQGGLTYTITAQSRFGQQSWSQWSRESTHAISSSMSDDGDLELQVSATPDDPAQGPSNTTATIRVVKGGRPDDFLRTFVPA